MTNSLPSNPSLDNLRKQAKTLQKAWKAGDPAALARIRASHPQYANASDNALRAAKPRLTDCQLVLAREAGFDNWSAMKVAIESAGQELVDQFLKLAVLNYYGPHSLDRPRAYDLLRDHPQLAKANIWSAATVGNGAAVGRFIDQDPGLVNRIGGPNGWPPLLYLCHSRVSSPDEGHDALATAKLLLAHGANPNAHYWIEDAYKFTCLTGAIGEGEAGVKLWPPHEHSFALAKLLLDGGADPNDSQGLYNSMFTGGTPWLQLLLDYGLTNQHLVNWVTDNKIPTTSYLLAQACKYNQLDRAELLLKHGADANGRNYYSKLSCYETAVACGNTDIAELLLHHGAEKIEPQSQQERFYAACMAADQEAVATMRRERPDEIASWIKAGESQLVEAAEANKLDAARLLLELGFPVGGALFEAAWKGHFDMARLLVEHGANVRARDKAHRATAAAHANRAGQIAVRDFLLAGPIDIFDAIHFDRVERIDGILADDAEALERPFGAYTSEPPEDQAQTPLAQAVVEDKSDAVRALLEHGADITAKHHDGRTLLQLATDEEFGDIAEMLRQAEGS